MRLIGVHHTGITVSELDRSIDFYKRLGFKEEERVEESGPDVAEGTGIQDARLRVAMLVRDSTRLELIQYVSPDGGPPAHPNNGIGAAHVAIEVDDIDAVISQLQSEGVEFLSDAIYHPSGVRWVYMKDPDHITAELFEIVP